MADTAPAVETSETPVLVFQKNLRIKVIPGQMLLIEGVTDWTVDSTGLDVHHIEVTVRKAGDETVKETQKIRKWFNANAVITVSEEYVRL